MSMYTHIFLRKGDEFLEVSCTGRSSALSEMLEHYAPWEKVRLLTVKDLTDINREYTDELNKWKKYITDQQARKALIASFNNSVEDKMEAIRDCDDSIAEATETVDELSYALMQIRWLISIAEDADGEYGNRIQIYAGTECGGEITPDMIEA